MHKAVLLDGLQAAAVGPVLAVVHDKGSTALLCNPLGQRLCQGNRLCAHLQLMGCLSWIQQPKSGMQATLGQARLGRQARLAWQALLATLTCLHSSLLVVVRVRTLLFKRFVTGLAKLEFKKAMKAWYVISTES